MSAAYDYSRFNCGLCGRPDCNFGECQDAIKYWIEEKGNLMWHTTECFEDFWKAKQYVEDHPGTRIVQYVRDHANVILES